MENKVKNFLFSKNDENQFDTTVVLQNDKRKVKDAKPNIVAPTTFGQVEAIANDLLEGKSIIVDLTSCEISEAKRICDFLNGVSFALDGHVEKVAKLVYLFSSK